MDAEPTIPCILLPLDGSPLAERALSAAERVARGTGSVLLLAQVLPLTTWAFATPSGLVPEEAYRPILAAEEAAAHAYLERVAVPLRGRALPVETCMPRGDAAEALLDLEHRYRVACIVMTTHGRTGLGRAILGSVADRLVRAGHVPVLLIRGAADTPAPRRLERALVPLDGSAVAETALDVVEWLADGVVREVTLLRVVEAGASAGERAAARHYLDRIRRQLAARWGANACALAGRVAHGDPADQIVRCAREGSDLVVMATRGLAGARRWALGSVADRVLRATTVPLFLACPSSEVPAAGDPTGEAGAEGGS